MIETQNTDLFVCGQRTSERPTIGSFSPLHLVRRGTSPAETPTRLRSGLWVLPTMLFVMTLLTANRAVALEDFSQQPAASAQAASSEKKVSPPTAEPYRTGRECRNNGVYEPYPLPPVHFEAFRTCLLQRLQRTSLSLDEAGDIQDITERIMNAGFGPFCNVDIERRKFFWAFVFGVSLSREYREKALDEMKEDCGIRIFAGQSAHQRIFIAVYGYTSDQMKLDEPRQFLSMKDTDRLIAIQAQRKNDRGSFLALSTKLARDAFDNDK